MFFLVHDRKGFFHFGRNQKLAETAIFLFGPNPIPKPKNNFSFGRNQKPKPKAKTESQNRKPKPKAETEMTIFVNISIYGRRRNFLFEISFDNCSSRLQK